MNVFFLEFDGKSDIPAADIDISVDDSSEIYINNKRAVSRYNPCEETKRLASTIDRENNSAVLHISLINLDLPFFLSKNSIIFEWNKKLYTVVREYFDKKKFEKKETLIIKNEEDLKNFFKKDIYEKTIIYCYNPSHTMINAFLFHYPGLRFTVFASNKILNESDQYKKIKNLITALLNKKNINSNTAARFGKDWVKNFYANLADYVVNKGVICFKDCMKGVGVAIVIGAGYSLSHDLPLIIKNRKKAILLCVDTSLKILSENGIIPDFIISADSQSINSLYISHGFIDRNNSKKTVLVTMPTNNRLTFKNFCGKVAFSSVFFPLIKKIDDITFSKIELGAGGTVASMAYDFAQFILPKYILFSGLDFNFSNNCLHAKTTLFDKFLFHKASYINSYEDTVIKAQLKGISFLVKTKGGGKNRSDSKFMVFKDWFVGAIRKSSIPTYFLNDMIVDNENFVLITDEVNEYLSTMDENLIKKTADYIQSVTTVYDKKEISNSSTDNTLKTFLQSLYTQILSTEHFVKRAHTITYNWFVLKKKPLESDFRFLSSIDEKFLSFKALNDILSIYNQKHIQKYQYQQYVQDEDTIIRNQYEFYTGLYIDVLKIKKIIALCISGK